jgi:hypothetical protein
MRSYFSTYFNNNRMAVRAACNWLIFRRCGQPSNIDLLGKRESITSTFEILLLCNRKLF